MLAGAEDLHLFRSDLVYFSVQGLGLRVVRAGGSRIGLGYCLGSIDACAYRHGLRLLAFVASGNGKRNGYTGIHGLASRKEAEEGIVGTGKLGVGTQDG